MRSSVVYVVMDVALSVSLIASVTDSLGSIGCVVLSVTCSEDCGVTNM